MLATITADGFSWPLDTFIDAYRFDRIDATIAHFPPAFRYRAVLADGTLIGPAYGYEIAAIRPDEVLAVEWVAGGDEAHFTGRCSLCGAFGPLDEEWSTCSPCAAAKRLDDQDDHDALNDEDDRCPHCGGRL